MHVAVATASEVGGAMQLEVRVMDSAGAPVPDVRVIAAWEGERLPDAEQEDARTINECLTADDGYCTVTLLDGVLLADRPIRVAVTNLVHALLAYDISADAPSKVAIFD
jgi:hypothetical protein